MLRKIRLLTVFVIFGLIVSGLTAYPLLWEMNILSETLTGGKGLDPQKYEGTVHWVLKVREGLEETYLSYPFMGYGTDWLAFGHIIISLFFILPYRDPVRYIGVFHIGVVASLLVIPNAWICGEIRGIPMGWRLMDMAFGVICIVPLLIAIKWTRSLEKQKSPEG